LLVVQAVVSAMKQRENIWSVRLDGVEVVSFFGPHAQQWAFREREELAQLLEAQPDAEPDDLRHRRTAFPFFDVAIVEERLTIGRRPCPVSN
jgi:hypothetical protein